MPRLSLRVEEAAAALGVSDDLYRSAVAPHLQIVRLGRVKLVAIAELERFLAERGERVLGAAGAPR